MSQTADDPVTKEAEARAAGPVPPGAARGMRRRGGMFDRELTQGSIAKNLWALALPTIGESVMNMLDTTIDMIWVGRLGARPLAAVGVSGTVTQLLTAARVGISTGERALVSRFFGAGDYAMVNHVALQAFVLSGLFACLMAAIGIFLAEPILRLLGLEADLIAEGLRYVQIAFVSSAFMAFRMMATSILQAAGDTVVPMWITLVVRIFHMALDPFLIFGWAGFPRFGLNGAALANVFANMLGSGLGLWVLFKGYSRVKVTLKNFWVDFGMLWRIVKIGIPASVSGMERGLAQTALLGIIATFGTYSIAAYAVRNRVEHLVMAFGWGGLSMGAAIMVGQNLGAGRPERAVRTTWIAMGFLWLMVAVGATILLFWAEAIVCIFNTDPRLVEIASTWLRIGIAGFVFVPPAHLLSQVLSSGAGDTVPPMVVSLLSLWCCEVPLALFLSRATTLGVYGVAWGMVGAMVVRGIAVFTWFQLGRWKKKRV